jgi:DNA-binding FrmR family transcriptional regulator
LDQDVALRLRKIEGQVRGILRMIDEGRACPDLLTQLMAVRSAIDSVSISLLTEHMDSCLAGGQLSAETKEVLGDALRMFLRLSSTAA